MLFRVMDRSGDSESRFDVATPVGLGEAEKRFKEITGRGFAAIVPSGDGSPGTLLRKFDPTVQEVVFQPQLQGG